MSEIMTAKILASWSPNTVFGNEFSGELLNQRGRIATPPSVGSIFIDSGAVTVAVGEQIDQPLARPAPGMSTG
jgi:hypothetical protein